VKEIKQGAYFGEVAIIKECKRTATIKSKNFTTLVSLNLKSFQELMNRYPDIKDEMNNQIYTSYKDKWKKFIKRVLANIDYLGYGMSDKIIEELYYKVEIVKVNKDTYLFQSGKSCKEIHIIVNGEVDIFIKSNKTYESYLDTMYQGCCIGSYSVLTGDDYSISGKAKTDCTLLKLSYEALEEMRKKYDELNFTLSEYEDYIENEGLPYCDFKLYRTILSKLRPIK
jgi:CRP-like cAMP-binding protein